MHCFVKVLSKRRRYEDFYTIGEYRFLAMAPTMRI
jgi:hypothetical protein